MSVVRRLAPSACACVLGLLLGCAATAEPPKPCQGSDLTEVQGLAAAEAARADDLVNGDGLLWRIEKTGLAPSTLFGTIHSTDESALEIARRAAQSINGAKIVATELGGPIDTIEKANITAATLASALDRDHDTFEGAIAPEDRQKIEKLITSLGYPAAFAHHLKLWFLAILTGLPKCEAERETLNLPEVDQFLAETARDLGVKVIGLETTEEQLAAIANLRPQVAATLLALTARDPALNDDLYATTLRLYRQSRPAEIVAIADALGGLSEAERAAQDEFMRALLQDRNAIMAKRTAPLLASGGAFIAVGALHLAGKTGLVEQFRADGYTVTKVW
ncbi:MAG TPA: TraB/GumN family protein [Roseiarcus sp.]|nr:TraB/GumN family protein [Roseiarcus sp.]